VEKVDEYIRYYNEDRILEKLGYLTPKEFGVQAA
jgi:transposase InsO family protein